MPRLPRQLAVDVDLFVRGGLAILDAIEARGFDVLSRRPSLSRFDQGAADCLGGCGTRFQFDRRYIGGTASIGWPSAMMPGTAKMRCAPLLVSHKVAENSR